MNLGQGDYSVGCARNTAGYVQNLLKRARKEGENPAKIIRDLAQKPSKNLFSDRPSTRSLEALCLKFRHGK